MTNRMPSPKRLSIALVVIAVALACAVAAGLAIVTLSGTDSPDRHPIGVNATDRFLALDGLAGTVERVVETNNSTIRIVRHVRRRPGSGQFWTRTVVGPAGKLGRTVSNGSTTWVYSRQRNQVKQYMHPAVVGPASQPGRFTPVDQSIHREQVERLEQLFERLAISTPADDPADSPNRTVRVRTLPVLPQSSTETTAVPAVRNRYFRLTFGGTDQVTGRKAYVLRFRAIDSPEARVDRYNRTLFIDTEHFVVLRDHSEIVVNGRRVERTWTYRNVSFNPGIEDNRFHFDLPTNATVETVEPTSERIYTYRTRQSLADETTVQVPAPDLPPSFAFVRGVRWPASGSIRLKYANATAEVALRVNPDSDALRKRSPEETTVDINGREVAYGRTVFSQSFSWRCQDHQYFLKTEGLSKATGKAIAASVHCPTP